MTVIAYSSKHRIMAADMRASDDEGDFHLSRCTKITRLKSGALLGMSGDGDGRDLEALLERATPRKMPTRQQIADLKMDVVALLVFPRGQMFTITGEYSKKRDGWYGEVFPIDDKFVAVGSGKAYAYGAMEVGASPREAVRAACRRDLLCAGPIQVEPLDVTAKKASR